VPVVICLTGAWLRAKKQSQSFFQESGLARSGAGDEADYENSSSAKIGAQTLRHKIVLLQHIFSDFNQTGFEAHSSISNATTSSSFPCTISEAGVPHSEQQNNCIEFTGRGDRQFGQKIKIETSSTSKREPCSPVPWQTIS
jgi:hypothetical protein